MGAADGSEREGTRSTVSSPGNQLLLLGSGETADDIEIDEV